MKNVVICFLCGKEFLKPISEIKRMEKRGLRNHFCSNICSRIYAKSVQQLKRKQREEQYYQLYPKKCLYCNAIINYRVKNKTKYCSSKCAATHTQQDSPHRTWTEEEKLKYSILVKNNPYFNGTINKKTGKNVECFICNKLFYKTKKSNKITCSKKCYYEWVKRTGYLKGKNGGYREKGGRGKQGWYKGYYCNSSWELAWVIYNLEHNISFRRNTKGFEYQFNGRTYKFYPDFIMGETGLYVEVKSYIDSKNKEKISQFSYPLNIIGKKEIQPYINYVIEKYGKDFVRLYEKNS